MKTPGPGRSNVRACAGAAVMIGMLGLLIAAPARSADPEIERLRQDIDEVKRDLAEIKELLKQGASARGPANAAPSSSTAAESATVKIEGYPAIGQPGAPITIVEFSSFQCPFCRRHFERVLPEIKKSLVDEGKVRYVFHAMPLQSQPDSSNAAKAAWCAGEQQRDKYWAMHDTLFKNQRNLSVEALKRYAQSVGVDVGKFAACLDGPEAAAALERSAVEAVALGVRGTPTFFIGAVESGTMVRGRRLIGAQAFPAFKQAIEAELEQLNKK